MKKLFDTEGMTESERVFHAPGEFARENMLYMQEAGHLKSLRSHSCVRENLESYLLFLVLKGCGEVIVEGKRYPVKKGEAVFLDCRNHYEHSSSQEDPWELQWVHFDGKLIRGIFKDYWKDNEQMPILYPGESFGVMKEHIDTVINLQNEQGMLSDIKTSIELQQLLLLIFDNTSRRLDKNKQRGLRSSDYEMIRETLNQNFRSEDVLTGLGEKLFIPVEEIDQAFTERYGISLKDYIDNRKFNAAKELLRFSIKPIEEIVEESGIGDIELFKSLFLENEKMSPEDYRKKWAQWIKG